MKLCHPPKPLGLYDPQNVQEEYNGTNYSQCSFYSSVGVELGVPAISMEIHDTGEETNEAHGETVSQ
jgi:hypothetical protein